MGRLLVRGAERPPGRRHGGGERLGNRWGTTKCKIGVHGGKVDVRRQRVRGDGHEITLPSWEAAQAEGWLGRWAMNLMLINVSTRRFGRAVRLPEGDIPAPPGAGVSKSAASRRFVALSTERMREWMAADLSKLDLLVIQIDGVFIAEDLTLLAAIGIDGDGVKHPLGLLEGATENAAVVQALLDNLIERGLDPTICRLFIIDGSKALAKAIRRTFGRHTPIQRCQIHKARNILERLPKHLHAPVRTALRPAWAPDDANNAARRNRNLAPRLEPVPPGLSDRTPAVHPPLLPASRCPSPLAPPPPPRSPPLPLNMMGTIRRVCRNVKRWRDASMALRWTAAAMQEATKGFRRLKAHKQLPVLRAALAAHQATHRQPALEPTAVAA